MRTFICFTTDGRSSTPSLSFVFAVDEARARQLARRELIDTVQGQFVEIFEDGRLIAVECADTDQRRGERGA